MALTETLGPIEVTIPQAQVRWGGWHHPLGINVHHVTLKKEETNLRLEIPNLLLSVKIIPLLWGKAEIGQCVFGSAKLYSKNKMLGEVSGKAKRRGQRVSLQAKFQKIDGTALIYLMQAKNLSYNATLPFEGSIILEGSYKTGLSKINLEGKTEGGNLSIPEIYPEPVNFDKAEFSLIGSGQTLSLKKLSVRRGSASLTIQGHLHSPVTWKNLWEKGGKVQIDLEGKGGAIPVDDLHLLWPHGLSPKPRQWVVHQLSKGTANHVSTQIRGIISLDPGGEISRFEIPYISGDIEANGVTVDYFGKLPPVIDVKGTCHFTREQFLINAVGIANGIHLRAGKILINNLHAQDQTIDMKLDLEGPVRNSLEIMDAAPLSFAKKLGLDPLRISGQAKTHLHLAFPLETGLDLDLINVKAQSQIQEGEVLYEVQVDGKPVKLDQGTFSLDVTRKSLEMKGTGCLQGIPTQIEWQEHFADENIPFRRQFSLKGQLNLENLKNFGIEASDYISGLAEAHVHYTVNANEGGIMEGFADLTSAVMVSPVLSWQKEKGKAAHLKFKLLKSQYQRSLSLDEASLIAPNLAMVINGKNSKQGDVYQVDHLQIGKNHLKATIQYDKEGVLHALIQGKVLDLSHVLDDSAPESFIKPSSSKGSKNNSQIKVNLLLDEVWLGKESAIRQMSGEMLYHGDTLMGARLWGKVRHNEKSISLNMTPLSDDRQQFTLESEDGGHILEMLGGGYDVEGGHLIIKGIKSIKHKGKGTYLPNAWEIVGNININDFVINKAPLLARLLSAASLQGIVNIFSGKGIHFRTGEAAFSLDLENLNLKKVRLISPSLGLLLQGSIDRLRHKVNFVGELIPLYIINTFLANIPLVGNWISGGREDGIFMTHFTLSGDRQNPDLAINPITTVTPGLMREFMMSQERANEKTDIKMKEKQSQ
ncbi:MAG: AsmA-like C-terminal domain-containing protein [Candidatus Paracaedibacter sp.]